MVVDRASWLVIRPRAAAVAAILVAEDGIVGVVEVVVGVHERDVPVTPPARMWPSWRTRVRNPCCAWTAPRPGPKAPAYELRSASVFQLSQSATLRSQGR